MGSHGGQTVLLVSGDGFLCAAARSGLKNRHPEVRVSAVTSALAALQIVEETAPSVILLAEEGREQQPTYEMAELDGFIEALSGHAPVVVIGRADHGPRLTALIASGTVDYVSESAGCVTLALELLERRLSQTQRTADLAPGIEHWSKDFAEVLRHELNNPLTGILGNAELLLAEITRKNDGRLPYGGQERVETIAALAMRMRETVCQLSHEWEARNDPVREAEVTGARSG